MNTPALPASAASYRPSIREQLAGLVLVCVIPVWIVAGLLVNYAYVSKRTQTTERMQETVRALAQALDREQASVIASLQGMATSPAFATGNRPGMYEQAQRLLEFYPGSDIILADETEQQVINTHLPLTSPLPKRNIPEQVRRVFETRSPRVSNLFFGAVTKKPLLSIDVPVFRDGGVVFDLAMTLHSDRFASILLHQPLASEWTATILDAKGIVVYRM